MVPDLEGLRQRQRAMWATGDYPDIAATLEDVSDAAVVESGVTEGETVLDVATGTGNAALVAAWTPEGLNGQGLAVLGRHMPPPPEVFRPPTLWGSEEHVGELFAGASDVRCERRRAPNGVRAESADAWVDYCGRVLGPVVMAKRALDEQGGWPAARADLVELYERFNEADDRSMHAEPEYLLTVIR